MTRRSNQQIWVVMSIVLMAFLSPAAAKVIYVDYDGSADFNTIQAAIDDSNDGDTIIVADGTYTGVGNRDIDFLGKAITLRSANGPQNCIIDCNGTNTDPHRGFYFHNGEDANSVLDGFTIRNGFQGVWGGGILCIAVSPTIRNCIITNNRARDGGGILCHSCYGVTFINCIITENSASNGGGVFSRGDMFIPYHNLIVKNCTFSANSAEYGGAICVSDYSNTLMANCILWGDTALYCNEISMQALMWPAHLYISFSNVQGGAHAVCGFVLHWGLGNIDADPCFADPNNGDYHLREDSLCINAGDPNYVDKPNETDLDGKPRIIGGRIDMGAYEYQVTVIYVDANAPGPTHDGSSWAYAYKYLQDALTDADSAAKPVEIRVAEGIYKPDQTSANPNGTGNQSATFQLINGVTIKGGYAGFGEPDPNERYIELYETILSGDLNGDDLPTYPHNTDDNSYHVVTGSGTEPNAVLNGLTISSGRGSGMYNYGGSPTVADCTFSDNFASEGGGMYNAHFSDPVVTNCKFSFNQAGENGGAMYNENSNPVVTGCTFIANSIMPFSFVGFGGAVYNEECSPTFDYCTFSENSAEAGGGGMYNRDSSPTLTNCTFEGNWSGLFGGGFDTVMESSNPILIGCTFIGNSADERGGGTSNGTSSLTLINCIFIDNSAMAGGGGMYSCSGRNINVINCTFYGNEAPNGNLLICSCEPSNVQFANCIIWDGGNEIWNPRGSIIILKYSDVYGGRMSVHDPCESIIWGEGNIDADPCFADANNGDYHLKSQAGRWDANSQSWIMDYVSSPCIDAANPGCPVGDEPDPNGNRRNIGAYGGTAETSKSPAYWRSIADITNDWIVDSNDLKVFVSYWLQTGECIPSDLDRSRSVDSNDFALFAGQWRQIGPGPGIAYDIGGCIPVDFPSSALVESEPTRFTVTVEGQYILFEDMMQANCCPEELDVQMTVEGDIITIYEIERFFTRVPCPCMCDYPITATLGPFEPATYTFEVYQGAGFIGTTTVTIAPGS